jgi:hypothetical protein
MPAAKRLALFARAWLAIGFCSFVLPHFLTH